MSAYHPRSSALRVSKGERTRARLLDSAVRSFVRHGYDGASLEDLAREAGVNRALFNHYFGSKEELILECIHHVFDAGREIVVERLASPPDGVNAIERYFRANFEWLRKRRHQLAYVILALHRASYDPRTRQVVHERFQAAWSRIEAWMKADPLLSARLPPDPLELARTVHTILLGGVAHALADPLGDIDGYERRCLQAVDAMVSGLSRTS